MEYGRFSSTEIGPPGACFGALVGDPRGTPPGPPWGPPKIGGEILSRLGELLNTLQNVHPRGVPGGPRGRPWRGRPRGSPPGPPRRCLVAQQAGSSLGGYALRGHGISTNDRQGLGTQSAFAIAPLRCRRAVYVAAAAVREHRRVSLVDDAHSHLWRVPSNPPPQDRVAFRSAHEPSSHWATQPSYVL